MSSKPSKTRAALLVLALCCFVSFLTWKVSQPTLKQESETLQENQSTEDKDASLVRHLLAENLSKRRFDFSTVVQASADRKVIPLDENSSSHQRVIATITTALEESITELSRTDSPIRELRRINEGSRFFEEALMKKINATDGITCEIPTTREGEHQRSGYPDLRLIDEKSGEVFYLDPKLVEQSSWKSSFRTFYFEPKIKTLKINDDAVHLLVGIGHDLSLIHI